MNLPLGVDINNLLNDLRGLSWEAADILLYYSKQFRNEKPTKDLTQFKVNNEPVTEADLKVNSLIIKRISENYRQVKWHPLSPSGFPQRVCGRVLSLRCARGIRGGEPLQPAGGSGAAVG